MSSRSSSNYPEFPGRLRVGFVRAAHGIRGEILLSFLGGGADWLARKNHLDILVDGSKACEVFEVVRHRSHKDGVLATLGGVVDRDGAEALRGAQIYVEADRLVSQPGEAIYLREILEFELRDVTGEMLGRVVDFSSNGPQDLLVIDRAGGGRALVPFIEAFVRDIDFDKRVVRVDLPPGLLTLGD